MNKQITNVVRASLLFLFLPGLALAQHDAGIPQVEDIESLYPGKAYSPWAERSFPSRVFWGETHLHTGLSLDAGLFGNTTGHDTAYRLARGEQIIEMQGLGEGHTTHGCSISAMDDWVELVTVDLHRNLTQEQLFIASKTDPPVAS